MMEILKFSAAVVVCAAGAAFSVSLLKFAAWKIWGQGWVEQAVNETQARTLRRFAEQLDRIAKKNLELEKRDK